MKTFFKVTGVILFIIIALLIVMPFVFKGKITELAKDEINKNVNAQVDFTDFSLSLFKNFPNFNFGIKGLIIIGNDEFESDTLANIDLIEVTLDLVSVIKGDRYKILRIKVSNPDILVKITKDGLANYNIGPPSEKDVEQAMTEEADGVFNLSIKHFEIVNGEIDYIDKSAGIIINIFGFTHKLKGDLSEDFTSLQTNTNIEQLTLNYDGINYFSKTNVSLKADIDADIKNEIYSLKKNELKLNQLKVNFDGSVSMVNDDINLVLTLNAPETEFKNILSLIPVVYAKDFETIQTSGKLTLDGNIKGLYNENNLPAFTINLGIADAMFKYPDLPQAVTNISVASTISNKGGSADNTIVNVSNFHVEMGKNPIDLKMSLKTPVSDPDINGKIKGTLDLGSVHDYYPLDESEKLNGTFVTNITLKGKLSAIENEQYENFTAFGSMLIKGLNYSSTTINYPVEISNAQLNFSPGYLDLVAFNSKIGQNDLRAKGKLENYLPYFLKDETLKGNLTITSSYLNISDLMTESEGENLQTSQSTDEASMTVVEIPDNIDFLVKASIDKLIYDGIEMEHVGARIEIKDQKLDIKNLSTNVLDGELAINGIYDVSESDKPTVDMNLKINLVDIQKAYNTFDIFSQYAPIANKTKGKFSTQMAFTTLLNNEMMPVYESLTGKGKLQTSTLELTGVNTINKIADALQMDKLKNMDLEKILFDFEFIDGKILIEPFDLKYNNYKGTLGGWTALDQTIDYVLNLNIPREEFGSQTNNILNDLVNKANTQGANFSLGDNVPIDLLIGGTITNPQINTSLKEIGKDLIEDVKEQVQEEIEKKKEELSKEAREQIQKLIEDADKQAQKLITEANKQANNIRKEADNAAKQIIDEGDNQANKLEDEGKGKGFLAEAAAKESAKVVRNEARNQANNLTSEADRQAKSLVDKAKMEAQKLKLDAQNEADKLLKGN